MHTSKAFIAATGSFILLSAGSVAFGPAALAQEESGAVLEEIIVTAQKRTETLAEIPISITVLAGDTLERQFADNFQDFVNLVPGLSINTNTRGVTRLTLRGINTGGVATTIGVYVDDVPFGSSSGLANAAVLSGDFDTFDVSRVEVLRGPQGTLYGASSLGGVMRYVTNPANTDAFEAKGRAAVESVEGGDMCYALTGMVNIPASDTFALRASGFYRYDGGYIDSIGNNPIPAYPDPSINIVDGTRVEDNINSVASYGGRVSALIKPNDRFSLNLTALLQNIESDASDQVDADPDTLEPLYGGDVRSRYQLDPNDIKYRLYSATIDWDLGAATLQSITSYSTFDQAFHTDIASNTSLLPIDNPPPALAAVVTLLFGDATTRPLSAILDQATSTDKFAQEFRLVSNDNDMFEWLLGLYYTNEDSAIDPQNIVAVEAGTDNAATGIPIVYGASVTSDYEEYAFFANATWHITDQFEVSFGGRTSKNDQNASQSLESPLLGGSLDFENAKSSEHPFTYSVAPRFEFNDTTSVYARVATGYRPGGPNVVAIGSPPDTPRSYDSDSLTDYEIGLKTGDKSGMFGIDLTAYYLDWDDIQLLVVVNSIGVNGNGGTAVSKGFELAGTFRPIDGLTLALNGAYTDAYLTEDTDPIVGGSDGDPLPYVPEWSFGASGDYEWPVMGDSMAYVGASLGYTGERHADFSSLDSNGNVRKAGSFTTVALRAGLDAGRWSVEIYGKNLTDEQGINDIGATGFLPNNALGLGLIRPRTYGLAIGAKF